MTTSYVAPRTNLGHSDEPDGNDAWDLAEALVARWQILIALPVLFAALAAIGTFLTTPKYTAITTFIAATKDPMSSLGSFASAASQLGVGLPSISPSNSPQFYADVLRSREVVEDVLRARIPKPGSTASNDSIAILELFQRKPYGILDLFERKPYSAAARLDQATRMLLRETSVSVNPRTSIVELRVVSVSPEGSALVAKDFLKVLNRFNLEKRQSQAGARRRFLETRLSETRDSLSRAEQTLQSFLEANRQFKTAPALQARFDAIRRQVTTYEELYSSFRQEFESARVDEINDTPLITVIDSAAAPLQRSSPRRLVTVIVGGVLGAFVALVYLVAGVSAERLRRRSPLDYERFLRIKGTFLKTLGIRRRA